MKLYTVLVLFVLSLVGQMVLGQILKTNSIQGVLTDAQGNAIPDGNYGLTFRLYTTLTNGTSLWEELHENVAVQNGIFNVILGSIVPLNLPFNQTYYLGITVANDDELSPRMELTSTPYSLIARTVRG